MERLNDIEKKQMTDFIVEQGFVGRKGSNLRKKTLVAIVATLMIGIPIFGVTFPALAEQIIQHIPVVGGIFGREDLHHQERLVVLEYHATEIGQSLTFDGVTLTIVNAIFDGRKMHLSYMIESDRELGNYLHGEHFNLVPSHIELIVDGTSVVFTGVIDGKRHTDAFLPRSVSEHDLEHRYIGVYELSKTGSAEDLRDSLLSDATEIEVIFNISEIRRSIFSGDYILAEGEWNFNFKLEVVPTVVLVVNEIVETDEFTLTIEEVVLSPVGTRVHFSYTRPHQSQGFLELSIVDNFGDWLLDTGAGGGTSIHVNGQDSRYFDFWKDFVAINPDATSITITPRSERAPSITINLP